MSDIIIKPSDWNIDAVKYGIKPGDRVILQGPNRDAIEFHNLIGTKEKSIIITATDKVLVKRAGTGGRVVQFFNCDYVRLTGGPGKLIEITGGGHGVTVSSGSNHAEIDNLYIHHVGYSGIDITNYPTCDPKTWRGAYTMEDILVHDNRITDLTDGEAIYIGPSHYHSSFPLSGCPSGVKSALEHDVKNVQVVNNYIDRIGADGIQVGGATGGKTVEKQEISGIIRGNEVRNTGLKKVASQASGIQANPGSALVIEGNTVDGCTNFGIIVQGRTSTVVRRNRISNTVGGIMTVARETADKGTFQVYDNTFTDITGNGVESYSNTDFSNNILQVKTGGTLFKKYGGTLTNTSKNVELFGNSEQLKLDANFVPMEGSPAYMPDQPADIGAFTAARKPKTLTEAGTIKVETTGTITKIYVVTPSGKRIELQ